MPATATAACRVLPSALRPMAADYRLRRCTDAAERARLEQFIHAVYARSFGANIRQFLPTLYSLTDGQGELVAALGLRSAAWAPLFLEQYLQRPVEQVLAQASGRPVCRHQVVEVGNLAGREPGVLRRLLPRMGEELRQAGFRWMCFTGHVQLVSSFARCGVQLLPLANASSDCLPTADRADWGSYYAHAPVVLGCDISAGQAQLRAHPELLANGRIARSDA